MIFCQICGGKCKYILVSNKLFLLCEKCANRILKEMEIKRNERK